MKEIEEGIEIKGSITKEIDKRFLSSIDLIGHGEVTLTIDRVEKINNFKFLNGQKKDKVILCYFKETKKPLCLNITNISRIINHAKTNKCADWHGLSIKLTAEEGVYFGKKQSAVRVQI